MNLLELRFNQMEVIEQPLSRRGDVLTTLGVDCNVVVIFAKG